MPDFFETLKHGLGKGVSTVSIKSKEMRDTSRVKSQIADLERQKKDAIAALGMSVCGMLDSGPIDETALRAARAAIAGFDQQISEKQEEVARIHAHAKQALEGGTAPKEIPADAHCTSCGAALAPSVTFCGSCGKQISSAVGQLSETP